MVVRAAEEVKSPGDAMIDSNTKQGRWTAVTIGLAVVVLLPVLYVLSWGPAYGQMQHGRINDAAFDTFYYPLIAVGEHVAWIKEMLNDYGALWV